MTNRKSSAAATLTVGGVDYVVLPKAEYLNLLDKKTVSGAVDAHAFVRRSIGADLRAARRTAKLTQSELAHRLGKSQTLISQAESGSARVSERYVRAVLKACGLPARWTGPKAQPARRPARRASE
jgi:ribosome-binding protein aMBF1 (putative translation factor)